jgi:hypothetical protein
MRNMLRIAALLCLVAASSGAVADSYEKIGGKCMYCCCSPKQCKESSQPGNCGMSAKDNMMSSQGSAKANEPPAKTDPSQSLPKPRNY